MKNIINKVTIDRTVKELRTLAKNAGLLGYSRMRKADLVAFLEENYILPNFDSWFYENNIFCFLNDDGAIFRVKPDCNLEMEKRCKWIPVRDFVVDTLKMEYKEEMEEKYGKDGLLEFGEKLGNVMYDEKETRPIQSLILLERRIKEYPKFS